MHLCREALFLLPGGSLSTQEGENPTYPVIQIIYHVRELYLLPRQSEWGGTLMSDPF